MLEPSDATPSSVTTGSMFGVGQTVSMCALSISGSASLSCASQVAMRLPWSSTVVVRPAA